MASRWFKKVEPRDSYLRIMKEAPVLNLLHFFRRFYLLICLRERECMHVHLCARIAERAVGEEDSKNPKQNPSTEPDSELDLMTLRP